jgi:hypothetical protein
LKEKLSNLAAVWLQNLERLGRALTIEKKPEGKATSERSYPMSIEKPGMNRSQKTLICLWLLCLLIVGGALFSTPYMRNAPVLGVNGQDGLLEGFFAFR